MHKISEYEQIITGRSESLFAQDIESHRGELRHALNGARIAVVGAAGSIGGAVVRTLLRFEPGALVLFDLSENNLVELVRDLRSTPGLTVPEDFATLPIRMGSREFACYFRDHPKFDFLLNLAAIKHVRSEKDIYCLSRMLKTNVLYLHDFLTGNPYRFRKVFSVSSDKAVKPASLMGASKMAMEQVLLHRAAEQPFSTARFANVACSDGSLPFGFLHRLRKQQPLSAPNDVKRYFISHEEAGELCVLSCAAACNGEVFFPKLTRDGDMKTFSRIAVEFLEKSGYEPVVCESEEEARTRIGEDPGKGKWPCYFFSSDTSGEKPFEEFVAEGDTADLSRFAGIGITRTPKTADAPEIEALLRFCAEAIEVDAVTKADFVEMLSRVVPTLEHLETGRTLDQKM